jgi:hypothetical protein
MGYTSYRSKYCSRRRLRYVGWHSGIRLKRLTLVPAVYKPGLLLFMTQQ